VRITRFDHQEPLGGARTTRPMDAGTTAGATTMATSMRRPITMLGMALMAVVLGMTALMPAAMAQEAQS
jgi:hypothetical protein